MKKDAHRAMQHQANLTIKNVKPIERMQPTETKFIEPVRQGKHMIKDSNTYWHATLQTG